MLGTLSRHKETEKLATLLQLMSRKEARKKRKALTRERTCENGGGEEALAEWNQIENGDTGSHRTAIW